MTYWKDADLCNAVARLAPGGLRDDMARALARRNADRLSRKIPSPRGRCSAGRRVVLDDKGPMSSGYVTHYPGYGRCDHDVTWDSDDAPTRALKALRSEMYERSRLKPSA